MCWFCGRYAMGEKSEALGEQPSDGGSSNPKMVSRYYICKITVGEKIPNELKIRLLRALLG